MGQKAPKIKNVIRWVLSNPSVNIYRTYSYMMDASYGDFTQLIQENIDYIDLLTFEEFCKKYNIKIKDIKLEIPHPPKLIGTRVLIMFSTELQVLCSLPKLINAKKIFEIGTFEGETITNIAHNVPDGTEIYTLDLPQEEIVEEEKDVIGKYIKNDSKASKIIKMLSGNSLTFDFSQYHDKIDIMFIDGGTTYKCIFSDSENAIKCVKNKGFIVWHDFFGVNKSYLGLAKAIFDICKKYNLKLHLFDGTRLVIVQNIKK